jgi:opacity protein-like surface antigen
MLGGLSPYATERKEMQMSRNLKSLALAVVAVFMLSAVAASAVQAATHHNVVGSAPAILTGEQSQTLQLGITGGEHTVGCGEGQYEAEEVEATSTQVTATPTLSECRVDPPFGPAATIALNHCAFLSTGVTDANGDAGIEIECSAENEITITYSIFGSTCVVHLTPQATQGGVHYSQSGNNVEVNVTVSGVKYHETGAGFCPASHTGEDGTIEGRLLAKAFKEKAGCSVVTETAKTTPGTHFNECEGEGQKLEVKENVT